jgi:hypothetical protein
MLDLLPLIATTHRIKLYRSEYVFVMSEADQVGLQNNEMISLVLVLEQL